MIRKTIESKRFPLFLWAALLILVAGAAMTVRSQEYVEYVSDSAFTGHLRAPVPFLHDDHNERAEVEECNACHHVYTDGEKDEYDSSEGMECSECHPAEGEGRLSLARVYHLQCKGCHASRKAGPVACGACHPGS